MGELGQSNGAVSLMPVDTQWTHDGHTVDTTMDATMDTVKHRCFAAVVGKRKLLDINNCLSLPWPIFICIFVVSIVASIVVSTVCPLCAHRASMAVTITAPYQVWLLHGQRRQVSTCTCCIRVVTTQDCWARMR